MLQQLKSIGLRRAWLGLDDRSLGILHQNVIQQAVKDGYLIAPYDSTIRFSLRQNLKCQQHYSNIIRFFIRMIRSLIKTVSLFTVS
nr:glycoside hydrolase [Coxiella burnetii]